MPIPITQSDGRRKSLKKLKLRDPDLCTVAVCSVIARYETELERHRAIEAELGDTILRDAERLNQKDETIRQKDILSKEAEHRLLNGLQLVRSVLAMQSRSAENAEAGSKLKEAAQRVSILARVHQRLHAMDFVEEIELKGYLEQLGHDLSEMVSMDHDGRSIRVEGAEMKLLRMTATPLAFIASELITNAMKHAHGKITINLERLPNGDGVLSVTDDGPGLPENFDPAASTGLGMKIIEAFARQIQGALNFGKGEGNLGTRFAVTFRLKPQKH
ncbi:sensor histidine kinase [Tabrizicola sp. WMC-M-20]|nr:sensor histidine kinase [Tabrizicola sp. WMC-M-20]